MNKTPRKVEIIKSFDKEDDRIRYVLFAVEDGKQAHIATIYHLEQLGRYLIKYFADSI